MTWTQEEVPTSGVLLQIRVPSLTDSEHANANAVIIDYCNCQCNLPLLVNSKTDLRAKITILLCYSEYAEWMTISEAQNGFQHSTLLHLKNWTKEVSQWWFGITAPLQKGQDTALPSTATQPSWWIRFVVRLPAFRVRPPLYLTVVSSQLLCQGHHQPDYSFV